MDRCRIELTPAARVSPVTPESFVAPLAGLKRGAEAGGATGDILAYAVDAGGARHPLAVGGPDGVRLNFDLPATLDAILGETYPGAVLGTSIVNRLPFDYTRLPMWMIGLASKILGKPVDFAALPSFPSYPIDCSADLLAGLAQGNLEPLSIAWPEGKKYAAALTHDVDTSWIFRHPKWLDACCEIEEGCGMRSAWYAVPTAMDAAACRRGLARLAERGHEIGVHGLTHDPALAGEPFEVLAEKFGKARKMMAEYLDGPPGYRAPWLSRSETMRRALAAAGYLYDTSSPCSDFQRNNAESNNGCGTLHPFVRSGLVVLPITIPQDSMASAIGKGAQGFWDWCYEILQEVKARGGVAVVSTHLQPHHSANEPMQEGYRSFLQRLARDADAWLPLPREAARLVARY